MIRHHFEKIKRENKLKTPSVRLKSKFMQKSEKCCLESCSNNEAEDEPPGESVVFGKLEEELPGKTATNRHRFFGDITDNLWNDWKWQFRNRITSIKQLAQFIPLSILESNLRHHL